MTQSPLAGFDSPWNWPELNSEEVDQLASDCAQQNDSTNLYKYFAVRRCLQLKAEIDAGSGFAVLSAVRACGTYELVMPDWLVYAFNRRYDAVLNFRAISWDDPLSFGKPYAKGTNANARQKARSLRYAIYNAVTDILKKEPGTAIDRILFDSIGETLHPPISGSLAERYYYELRDFLTESTSSENPTKSPKSLGEKNKPR